MTAPANGEAAAETPATEAVTTPKEKRRTSFFGSLGGKKDKKETSDNEATEETKTKSNKFGGLFRKPSKGVKLDKEEVAAETDAKADKPEEAKAEETAAQDAAVEEAPKPVETAVPAEEAKNVNVAASTPVQAAA